MVTKETLANQIAENYGLTKCGSKQIVDEIFDTIVDEVANGGRVSLYNFGSFEAVHRKAYNYVSPNGKKGRARAATLPRFRTGRGFRDAVDK